MFVPCALLNIFTLQIKKIPEKIMEENGRSMPDGSVMLN
jgi:hypothetical protein